MRRVARWALLALLVGCASGPRASVMSAVAEKDVPSALEAYERYRAMDGPDGELLAEVAAVVLESGALSPDPDVRDAALLALEIAGTAGEPVLETLAEREGKSLVGVRASEVLARRGRGRARDYLYGLLDEEDPLILASAVTVADPEDDAERLRGWLVHPVGDLRRAAAERLARAAPDSEARLALAEAARVDPRPDVRGAAVRALGAYGPEAFEALRGRLGDPHSSVRLAAVRALVEVDRERGLVVVGALLETQPSPAGIEAARVIALAGSGHDEKDGQPPGRGVTEARTFLKSALASGTPSLRAQAGTALASLPSEPGLDEALATALDHEKDPGVRLQLARALYTRGSHERRARRALEALLPQKGMPAVQAATILAGDGHRRAVRVLLELLQKGKPLVQRVAARALARDAGEPDRVRSALEDGDPLLRVAAAGGILAAASG